MLEDEEDAENPSFWNKAWNLLAWTVRGEIKRSASPSQLV